MTESTQNDRAMTSIARELTQLIDTAINGKTFFQLPKVYEIGLQGSAQDQRRPGVVTDQDRARLEQESPSRISQSYSGSGRQLVAQTSQSQVSC